LCRVGLAAGTKRSPSPAPVVSRKERRKQRQEQRQEQQQQRRASSHGERTPSRQLASPDVELIDLMDSDDE
jgi:hypothetical protein